MRFILFVYLLFFSPAVIFAGNIIVYSDPEKTIQIGNMIELLEDPENSFTPSEVFKSDKFIKSKQEVPNLQISKSSFWVRFEIENTTDEDLILELPYPILDEVYFFRQLPGGGYSEERTGENIPYYKRKFEHQNYIFDLQIPKGQTRKFLIKVRSSEQMQIPCVVGSYKGILESLFTKDLIFGLYAGIILVMFFYNLFVYFVVKDTTYLYYVAYIMAVGLTQACLQGYSFRFLWPDSALMANQSMVLSPSLAGIGALLFVNSFLQVKNYTPVLYKLVLFVVGIYIIAIILGFFNLYHTSQEIVQACSMLGSLLVFVIAYKIIKKGLRSAKFFLIAWSIFLGCVIVFVLRTFDFLPYNNFTYYALQMGSGLEVILLSLALADRINIFKKEKEESQTQALNALRENERIIKEQNVLLESKVEERTFELKKSNEGLTTILTELKQTQSQLVNAEKMASLGQLTAGIAHEINNPINFVVSNVKPLQRDIEDIHQLVSKYESLEVNEKIEEKIQEINKFREEIDYEYIKEEIANLLKGIEEGATRTADIVKGLRVFSRLDENDLKRTSIVEGIESTLTLLNPEISGSMELVKNYSPIPDIECYPGKMNQVFMNILNNAIFAIKDYKERKEKGKLEISISNDGKYVSISIKDNGIGMSEEVKAKVFEPFFTTKDVGKGTGLGMSITFSIIKDHNGLIEVNSEYGSGTEFIIKLPILQ